MKLTSHIALLAAVVAAALASGCGGSAASSSAPSPVLPHDQLIARADRICGAYSHTTSVEFRDVESNEQAAALWDTYLGQFDRLISDLRALRPSPQDAAAYRAWLDAGERQRPLMVAARPPASDDATGKLVLAVAEVNAMAADLGMRDCSIDIDLSEHPITRQRYVQLADGICANAATAYGTVRGTERPGRVRSPGSPPLMPLFRMTERDLDAIPAPAGDEDRVAAWRSAHNRALADDREDADRGAAGRPRGVCSPLGHDAARVGSREPACARPGHERVRGLSIGDDDVTQTFRSDMSRHEPTRTTS